MTFYPQERVALFVDGANLWNAAKALQFDLDYRKLRDYFASKATLVRSAYFTRLEEDQEEFSPLRPLVDFLEYNGWVVITRPKDPDVDLAVGMMELVDSIDHFVLASGDSDFCSLLDALQRRGKRVTVLSTIVNRPAHCSDDLRRQADDFLELETLRGFLARSARAPREAATA